MDTLLLQIPGDRVGGGQPWIIMERLLIATLRACLNGGLFRLDCIPPGLHAVLPDSGADAACRTSRSMFRQFLALVPGLHTHIFMLHLADLAVGGCFQFLHRTGNRIMPQVSIGLFLHLLKAQPGLAFACRLVKDTLCFQHLLCRDGGLRRVQLIRCPVRAPDCFL